MGVRTPVLWNGMYASHLSNDQIQLILQTRQAEEIPNLTHIIYNFPDELIQRAIDGGTSVRQIIKEENIDYKQYIGTLRKYQTTGVGFMYLSPRSILADGCGLGKTAEVAGLINWLYSRKEMTRFLIAVETSALGQTQYELTKFTGLNIVALPAETAKLKRVIRKTDWTQVQGIVIKHSTLRNDEFNKWLSLNLKEDGTSNIFDTFFLDESSVIKKKTTKIYEYTQNICLLCKRVHLMNATVFEMNIMDIYNQVDMMNPEALPKQWRIEKDFCTYSRQHYWVTENGKPTQKYHRQLSGYKNQAIFKDALQLMYFGRSSKEAGVELPHIYRVLKIQPTEKMMLAIDKGLRYNEVLNCPSLVPDAKVQMTRKDVPKLDRLVNLINNEFGLDSVMVYCFHLEAQRVIAEELTKIGRKVVILNGSCKDEERFNAQRGINSGEYDVIITNIKKSLNLNGCNVCIFYSMETNPSKAFQIASRIDRHVDEEIKTFILLLYECTPEYEYFTNKVRQRAQDARDLTIDAKTTVDYLFEALMEDEAKEMEAKQ